MMRDRNGLASTRMLPDCMATAHPKKGISGSTEIPFDFSSGKRLHAVATLRKERLAPSLRIANSR